MLFLHILGQDDNTSVLLSGIHQLKFSLESYDQFKIEYTITLKEIDFDDGIYSALAVSQKKQILNNIEEFLSS